MRRSLLSRGVGAAVAVAIVLGLATGALAYWIGPSNGSATTVLADTQPLTLGPGTPTATLYPDPDLKATVSITASNPNAYFVHIGALVLDAGTSEPFVVDAAHAGCDVAVLGFVPQDNGGAGWSIPPRIDPSDGTLTINLLSAMTMGVEAASACQGATFTVSLEARTANLEGQK
jgi:hypothetical protein